MPTEQIYDKPVDNNTNHLQGHLTSPSITKTSNNIFDIIKQKLKIDKNENEEKRANVKSMLYLQTIVFIFLIILPFVTFYLTILVSIQIFPFNTLLINQYNEQIDCINSANNSCINFFVLPNINENYPRLCESCPTNYICEIMMNFTTGEYDNYCILNSITRENSFKIPRMCFNLDMPFDNISTTLLIRCAIALAITTFITIIIIIVFIVELHRAVLSCNMYVSILIVLSLCVLTICTLIAINYNLYHKINVTLEPILEYNNVCYSIVNSQIFEQLQSNNYMLLVSSFLVFMCTSIFWGLLIVGALFFISYIIFNKIVKYLDIKVNYQDI